MKEWENEHTIHINEHNMYVRKLDMGENPARR
jgi:hypothetical protein